MITANHASSLIQKGQVVAYPTESFYALGADATNPEAIGKLFAMKKREAKKPIALIAADIAQVHKYFYVSPSEMAMAKKYWPGPLTMLLQPKVPTGKRVTHNDKRYIAIQALGVAPAKTVRTNQGVIGDMVESFKTGALLRTVTVGVRVPGHARARHLAKLAGVPITATSANLTGSLATKKDTAVRRRWPTLPIMKGSCGRLKKPSTVLEVVDPNIKVHRQGAVKISSQ